METILVESGIYDPSDSQTIEVHHKEYLKYADHICPSILEAVKDIILK
jgi:hypothetical protein